MDPLTTGLWMPSANFVGDLEFETELTAYLEWDTNFETCLSMIKYV